MDITTSTTVVLTGDSITECGRREDGRGLGNGYAGLVADALPTSRVVNTGVGGDRLVDLEARWDEDVLAHGPDLVSVLVGVNDTWRRQDGGDAEAPGDFAERYDRLLRRTAATGAALVLVEPFVVPVEPRQLAWRVDLDPRVHAVRRLAAEHGAVLVPADGAMTREAERVGAVAVAADGVHPTPLGHRALADLWLAAVREATG